MEAPEEAEDAGTKKKKQSPVLLSRPELKICLAVSGASGPAGVQPTLPALRPLEAQPLRAGSCCDQLPTPQGRVNSVRDAVEVGPLLPGTEGPPPFSGFLAAVPGCPNVAGSLALSLSRLGRVAPRSTLCQSSHELAGSGLVVWATGGRSKARCGAEVSLETSPGADTKREAIRPSSARPPGSHSRGAPGSGTKDDTVGRPEARHQRRGQTENL
jgi:hypothetical protein